MRALGITLPGRRYDMRPMGIWSSSTLPALIAPSLFRYALATRTRFVSHELASWCWSRPLRRPSGTAGSAQRHAWSRRGHLHRLIAWGRRGSCGRSRGSRSDRSGRRHEACRWEPLADTGGCSWRHTRQIHRSRLSGLPIGRQGAHGLLIDQGKLLEDALEKVLPDRRILFQLVDEPRSLDFDRISASGSNRIGRGHEPHIKLLPEIPKLKLIVVYGNRLKDDFVVVDAIQPSL
jgi:hypothetical protein